MEGLDIIYSRDIVVVVVMSFTVKVHVRFWDITVLISAKCKMKANSFKIETWRI